MPEYTNTIDIESLDQEQVDKLLNLDYAFDKKDINWIWPKWEHKYYTNTGDLWYSNSYSKVYKRVHTDEEEKFDLKDWL